MSDVVDKKVFEERVLKREADKLVDALRMGLPVLKVTMMFNDMRNRLIRAGLINVGGK